MSFAWNDALGVVGVALVLWAYFALQTGRLRAAYLRYSLLNGVGASLVLVSLLVEFNLAAAVLEGAWVLISLIGIVRWWRARRAAAHDPLG